MKARIVIGRRARGLTGLALCALLSACCHWKGTPGGDGGAVRLDPPDQRPVWSVAVADAAEAGLLAQELALEPLRQEGATLYFYGTEELAGRLRELGYEPAPANLHEVYRRVVRVERRGSEEELKRYGVQLINREERHWLVDGTLASLRSLAGAGYRLQPIGPHEPQPREVRIQVRSREDVQRINALHVDIFSVSGQGAGPGATARTEIEVSGAAFDYQIDQLKALGFNVSIVPPVGEERGKP